MSTPYPFDLGLYKRTISTTSPESQAWFSRGLIWAYAFNHEESVFCFEQAAISDPDCAMAYWGLAYSLGPNYNKPWSFFDDKDLADAVERGHNAARTAMAKMSACTPVEQALITALQHRYPQERPSNCSSWNQGFADAMEGAHRDFPDDLDVITLYADALMNLNPWNLWDLKTGDPTPGAHTLKIKTIIDNGLKLNGSLEHPGLLHLYIHLMEMSPRPEDALATANHLRGLVPDGGHLHHMPTHLDVLCGHYQAAIDSNSEAIKADDKYLSKAGPLNFYSLYRCHDLHFRVYAAMLAGQYKVCIDTASQLESTIPKDLLQIESPPMADWLEAFLSLRAHILVRFGKWQDLIDMEPPEDQDLYCMTTSIVLYAKSVAFAATGRVPESEHHKGLFHESLKRVPTSRTLFNNTCLDILRVGEAMLDGELEYRRKNYDVAFEHLREAIRREDNLPYDEPWGWMQPTRHAYGALLMEQGYLEEAVEVYKTDLGLNDKLPRALRHPNNVWALHGLHESLTKLGRDTETKEIEGDLQKALAGTDVLVKASCYCRLDK
ncbi:probable TPR domain protein [Fusarium fujikuroi IMI 58289]|uniref:Probable TPR domain protein n=1 Tax=Gibberella fujikuroi (strain CBS 195.34 / IMI 58289 / NRRL A-6831) TaxID=1279085 RepID=S0ED20_GIBF5|nr:probable TPR domain protein [Fusarium fujikuroi IMI 58289]CCT72779.1 probable TPR domain protein [Fusarium fujikuroi IMI 58289]SCO25254.1 probable TPR domain protein [Fusarium fujikuroi]SCO54290.1 probable TPR domain protein [Fusarium fujikuroi]